MGAEVSLGIKNCISNHKLDCYLLQRSQLLGAIPAEMEMLMVCMFAHNVSVSE